MTGEKLTSPGNHFIIDLEAIEDEGSDQSKRKMIPGDCLWIKIRNSYWWPSQVVDEENVSYKPNKKVKDEVLVRLYGSYDYLYVDAVKSSSEFENIIKKQKGSVREAFQKALEKEVSRIRSAGNSKRKVSESKEQGGAGKADGGTNNTPKIKKLKQDGLSLSKNEEEQSKAKTPNNTKGASPEEAAAAGNLSTRRVRVMQSLGLIAPLGSPFKKGLIPISNHKSKS